MNTPMNAEPAREPAGRPLRTSDLAAAGSQQAAGREQQEGMQPVQPIEADQSVPADQHQPDATADSERLDPLFASDMAEDYRARWSAVQISFVDDPRRAVRQGDELVAQVMKSLAETFADE